MVLRLKLDIHRLKANIDELKNTTMLTLPNYHIINNVYESANSIVYRGQRNADNKPVILKVLKEDYPTPAELARYQQEYDIIRRLSLDGVVNAYSLEKHQNTLVMCLEDFGGESLTYWLAERTFSLKEVLQLAIQATEIVGKIHRKKIIHKDINPSNLIWNPSTGQFKIIDFGISTLLSRENTTLKNPNVLEGTLAYISPEQTGRMNRYTDYRTDLYALGVTFYELLTGQRPFNATEPLELVHCHIAKMPTPVSQVNPNVPPIISDIVIKLMAKNLEDRYQSALGLKWDLEKCVENLAGLGNLQGFSCELAQKDLTGQFQIPQKLYGRENDVKTLLQAFDRVSDGSAEMMLVAGYSGVGKSALVYEVHKPMTEKRGYFAAGKFDQFQRNIPYSALTQAFNDFCNYLLAESGTQLNQWREKMLTAIGNNGQVLIEVIPHLALIIGPQPAVAQVGPTEAQNRFNLVFQNFFRTLCQKAHPLVLFIDDLQWADLASINLLKTLVTDTDNQYFLIIGAYRDNEVDATHPLIMMVKALTEAQSIVNTIHLQNLALSDVNTLIAEALVCDSSYTQALTHLVYEKTQGNAFFTIEFLKSLYAQALLVFDWQTFQWQWELDKVAAREITDNVVALMANKIGQLSAETQETLKLAACIGNRFDLQTLAIIYQHSPPETLAHLWTALEEDLLLPLDDHYKQSENIEKGLETRFKFQHDRVQQAAYSLLAEGQEQAIHLQIARLLLVHTSDIEGSIFDIVNQFNKGLALVNDDVEKRQLAELNLMAGLKAKASTAYQAAFEYLQTGMTLLESNAWQQHYAFSLQLYTEAAEVAYLNTDFEQMEKWVQIVLQQAQTLLDKVNVYEVQIQAEVAQNKSVAALNKALTVLKQLGVNFPDKPNQSDIQRAMMETKLNLGRKPIEALCELPLMTAPDKLAAMRLLSNVATAAFITVPELFPLMMLEMVNLSFKHGNAQESTFGYVSYGHILCREGELEAGFQFGELASSLLEQLEAKKLKAKVINIFDGFIKHWKEPVRDTLKPLLEVYQGRIETGDVVFAAYCVNLYLVYSYLSGKELVVLEREMTVYNHALTQLKQETTLRWSEMCRQATLNLMGGNTVSSPPYHLIGDAYSESKMLQIHQQGNDNYGLYCLYFHKLILCYLFQAYLQALENAAMAEKYLEGAAGTLVFTVFHFYDSLARLAVYADASLQEQENILNKVVANQEKMAKWAKHAPMNYLHKFYLVEAERCRVLGKEGDAREYYDKAIEGAKEHEYLNEEALAYELAGQFYSHKSLPKLAQVYLRDAHYAYQRWGALAKVKDLEERYPQFLAPKTSSRVPTQSTVMVSGTLMDSSTQFKQAATFLDLNSVVKASQTLSGEIVLSRLLEKMMQIVIENAGAEKGFLLLPHGDNWFIQAEGFVDNPSVSVLQSIALESHRQIAKAIIYYVARTQESVVLNNATREGNFTQDAYVIKCQPKSVLCAPLLNQAKMTGILYLENNLTAGAFTSDRLEMLGLLSSQAAISIENSLLYNGLELKVAERTRDLEQEIVERKRAEEAAKVANQAKSQFLANMSHELRTPLNAILGFAQIMQRSRTLPSEHIDNVRIVNRSGEYLLSLINDVLDMSKIEAGKITLDEQNFDLHRLLDEVHDMFSLRAENKHLQLRFERGDEVSRYIRTDGTKLRQVLINLLSNALKFTQAGGIYLSVDEKSPQSLQGGVSKETTLQFRVEDTGAGVAAEELDKLFEAFTQTASGRAAQEGTGLGLPISRKFVQLMGGDITVQSEVGKGTVFQFTIHVPVVSATEIASEQRPQRQVVALEPNQPRFRLLIVDDKWDNRQLLIKLLNPFGFELCEACNGQEAVELCDSFKPDLIWMDIRMPVMDGLQATQQIKATPKGKEVAIVALTASTLEEEKTVALSAGCDDFLRKPFREADIFDLMHNYVGVRYVYEDVTDTASEPTQEELTSESLKALPDELLSQMQQAAIDLDVELMSVLIAQVRPLSESIANSLVLLVNEFQYDRLLELIESAQV